MKHLSLILFLMLPALPAAPQTAPGSLFADAGRYGDLASDLRARRVGDTITILVSDRLNATSEGSSAAGRKSEVNASISSLLGKPSVLGALPNLATANSSTKLDGTGSTNRSNVLTSTLSGRVVEVLPNGDLVVQATKEIGVNSEKHQLAVRGIVRWNDVSANNQVRSDRIGMMSIQLNGKGLVSDAIRRPNIVYRILLGLLPF